MELIRLNENIAINKDSIDRIERDEENLSIFYLYLKNNTKIQLSKAQANAIYHWYANYGLSDDLAKVARQK